MGVLPGCRGRRVRLGGLTRRVFRSEAGLRHNQGEQNAPVVNAAATDTLGTRGCQVKNAW